MAVKRGISIRKVVAQTKHGFLIGSADRAELDLTLSRYKEPAEPLEGMSAPIAPGRSCGGAWLSESDMFAPLRWSREPTDSRAFR